MSTWYNAGRVAPVPKGTWSAAATYSILDVVTDASSSKLYMAIKDVPAGISLTNTEYWSVVLDNKFAVDKANEAVTTANRAESKIDQSFVDAADRLASPFDKSERIVSCNPVEKYPLKVKTLIEPTQSGSGDPYPGGSGKNLLDIANATKATNSVSDVASDGKITIKGSLPVQWTNAYIGAFNMVSGKAYTISGVLGYGRIGFSTDPSITPGNTANPNISTGSVDIINSNRSAATFTANDTKTVYVWYCTDSANNGSNSAFTMGLQIEEGATASSYTPYSNIRPITGHTGAKLTRCGKNLFDKDSALLNSWHSYAPEVHDVQSWNGLFASKLIPVRPGEVFTLTNYLTDTSCALVKYLVSETDTGGLSGIRSGDVITCDGTKQIYTFTIPDRARYIGITGDMANIDKVQLELGSVATAYEPYQGDTFSASFGQTVYGGTLDWNKGEVMVDCGLFTLDGVNQKANLMSIDTGFIQVRLGDMLPDARKQAGNGNLICSHLPEQYGLPSSFPYPHVFLDVVETPYIRAYFSTTLATTASELNAYLAAQYAAGTPVQIAYKLANPITIQLTPAQILALKGTNSLCSDCGDTAVFGRIDPEWMNEQLKNAIIALGGNV